MYFISGIPLYSRTTGGTHTPQFEITGSVEFMFMGAISPKDLVLPVFQDRIFKNT